MHVGIKTPTPLQPNVVRNCNKFVLVKPNETCYTVASANGISVDQFQTWNPSTGNGCTSLWANAYACVSVSVA